MSGANQAAFTVRLSETLREQVREAAARKEISMAAAMRLALHRWIAEGRPQTHRESEPA